jgi:2-keto-4-pentenoate hydratase/2-oxohepta-3-ene-1,7-dioic acid hydratase in catechol pathway
MTFEEHFANALRVTGRDGILPAWYEVPAFYFTNPGAVYGDGDDVPMPADTAMLDYELELACVIGDDGRPEGFTIMNDFSARDLQGLEMQVGLDSRTGGMHHGWDRVLEAAARNTPGPAAGEVLGSGTVGRGCILEHGDGRWLQPGHEVELEIEGIGILRNRIV